MAERRVHTVIGGGGIRLHVEETGNPRGPGVLFIHGYSQCRLAWRRQMDSALAGELRLVAMDSRGHGLSEKPKDAYADSRLWADDVQAVINTLELKHPILCCSYGVVICDYVRHHGERDAIAPVDTTARLHARLLPNARLSLYPDVGHAPYLEDSGRFNRELLAFVLSFAGAAVPA
jgi:pimeloyl-ACP methyl ester carboxylesterase